MASLFDATLAAVTVSKGEYERLVRESEALECVKRYIENSKYATAAEISSILGISKESEEK